MESRQSLKRKTLKALEEIPVETIDEKSDKIQLLKRLGDFLEYENDPRFLKVVYNFIDKERREGR